MSDDSTPSGYAVADLLLQLSRWQEVTLVRRGEGPPEAAAPGADAVLTQLASLESLTGQTPTQRGASVMVVPDRADLDRLVALGEPWPGLLVCSRDTGLPAELDAVTTVIVDSTRLALATLSTTFDARPRPPVGIRPGASVAADAVLGAGVSIADGAVVAPGAKIGDGCQLRAHSFVGEGAVIGAGCVLHPHATVYDGVSLGDRVVLHAGAVIGADGFGYAASPRGAVKIRHLGGVRLGDDVEIGANSAVDRGTLDDTIVGPRTKIDNLCQVGHNVRIGSDCLVAGMTGIAGSVVIGDGVIIGGAVGIADHVTIGSGARIAGRSGVTKDVPPGETWAGFPARPYRQYARGLYLVDQLEKMWQHVRAASKDAEEGQAGAQRASGAPPEAGPAEDPPGGERDREPGGR